MTTCAPEATENSEITQRPLRHSRSFKVTNFGTNWRLIYDFLFVINTNLPPVSHRFRDIAFDRSKIATFGYPSYSQHPDKGVPLEYHRSDISLKTSCFGLHFCWRKFRYIFNHFYAVRHRNYRIQWDNAKLECGPMPSLMVALPNIGGALCSTPQSLADAHY